MKKTEYEVHVLIFHTRLISKVMKITNCEIVETLNHKKVMRKNSIVAKNRHKCKRIIMNKSYLLGRMKKGTVFYGLCQMSTFSFNCCCCKY
jgi:hypothetical protein